MIRALIGSALAHQALGQDAEAMDALAQSLVLAKPGGHIRVFVDQGPAMTRLLHKAAAQGVAPTYIARLLAAARGATAMDAAAAPANDRRQPLPDPLSERELDVLRLLATGRTNPEIAEDLYIAVSTVRSHCKNIYGKLGVHKRWDAVLRARELGLI
jgi:LuxR family maltose regulon positive regulatory protein